jgi:hypothetical protein
MRDSPGIFAATPRRSANIVVGISRTRLQSVLGRLACSIRLVLTTPLAVVIPLPHGIHDKVKCQDERKRNDYDINDYCYELNNVYVGTTLK